MISLRNCTRIYFLPKVFLSRVEGFRLSASYHRNCYCFCIGYLSIFLFSHEYFMYTGCCVYRTGISYWTFPIFHRTVPIGIFFINTYSNYLKKNWQNQTISWIKISNYTFNFFRGTFFQSRLSFKVFFFRKVTASVTYFQYVKKTHLDQFVLISILSWF